MRKFIWNAAVAAVLLSGFFSSGFAQDTPLTADAASARIAQRAWYVTNDGADSSTCGGRTAPCRSISQAIENAADGDSIWVGAGHYGNVSGDPNFTGPGDEHPNPTVPDDVGSKFQGCMICVTKGLKIYSLHGASVTVIEGTSSPLFRSSVAILSDGSAFGAKDHGFTITGGTQLGLTIAQAGTQRRNITVAGNVDVGDEIGFAFFGRFFVPRCDDCVITGSTVLSSNRGEGNQAAFSLQVRNDQGPGPLIVRENFAVGARTGFSVLSGGCEQCSSVVFGPASTVQLLNNVATHCSVGFSANLPGAIIGNTASANSEAGYRVTPGAGPFRRNSAIGNGGPGMILNFSPDQFFLDYRPFSAFGENNFYGNDRRRPPLALAVGPLPPLNPGPSAHCGVLNVGALAIFSGDFGPPPGPVEKQQAGRDFWGSPKGPAPTGAADAVGGVCDQNGGLTVTQGFATQGFAITTVE